MRGSGLGPASSSLMGDNEIAFVALRRSVESSSLCKDGRALVRRSDGDLAASRAGSTLVVRERSLLGSEATGSVDIEVAELDKGLGWSARTVKETVGSG